MTLFFGCDVDLTVCPSDTGWWDWLWDRASEEDRVSYTDVYQGLPLPYNLGALFPSVANPMDYWNDLDYSQFDPLPGSVEVLGEINDYFPVVFISHIEGGSHGKSKHKWLKHHFPFHAGVSYTREKWIHNNSVVAMVDDRLNHLAKFDYEKRILFETEYLQDRDYADTHVSLRVRDWESFDPKVIIDNWR